MSGEGAAPTTPTVLALVRDLFFRSKMDAVASATGAEIAYASTLDAAAKRCAELQPGLKLVVADLSDASFPALETATRIHDAAPGARLVGFASHVDLKPLAAARAAGFSLTLSKSEFTARLPDLLKS
jgi:DNA-binding NarL/FixJ family response regulator